MRSVDCFALTVVALGLVACSALAPSGAVAQEPKEVTFVVQRSLDPKKTAIWVASCPALKAGAERQEVSCTLERTTCTTDCKFTVRSTDYPPVPLIFGVSQFNDTCFYGYDATIGIYVYRCYR